MHPPVAFLLNDVSSTAENRAGDAPAVLQLCVRSVDDCIHGLFGQVAMHETQHAPAGKSHCANHLHPEPP
jgi:hypothetical protein